MRAIAESADTAGAPVRLGVSKPMGANSVSAEYSVSRGTGTGGYPRGSPRCVGVGVGVGVCVCVCVGVWVCGCVRESVCRVQCQ